MSNTELLQIRVSPKVRQSAEGVALESGFSSLQEALRLFLITYSKGHLQPTYYSNLNSKGGEVYDESLDEIIKKSLSDVKKGNTVSSAVIKKKLGIT